MARPFGSTIDTLYHEHVSSASFRKHVFGRTQVCNTPVLSAKWWEGRG